MIRKTIIGIAVALSSAWVAASDIHTVVRGDTLYSIANRYQTSVDALRQHNSLGSTAIRPGQELRIPGTRSSGATARNSATYTVRAGDSLSTIASRHGTSVQALRAHNGLRSNTIQPGQQLRIPGTETAEATSTVYTVRRGDSLSTIASRHGTSVQALRDHNGLSNNTIQPGQNLVIPGHNASTSAGRVAAAVDAADRSHTVRRGESLWSIANRHGVTMNALAAFNGISERQTLQPGQTLRIPATQSGRSQGSSNAVASAAAARKLALESNAAIIVDAATGTVLYEKNPHEIRSIASITKVMTALVVLDAGLPLDETLTVDRNDIDRLKNTSSRMPMGARLTRREMLHLALMSSENRAASALARHYPGGSDAFIAAMNRKARELGMTNTRFADSTGLDPRNVSTPADLAKLVSAASSYPLIAQLSTAQAHQVTVNPSGTLQYRNSNPLVQQGRWDIALSKTGYINEAGRCLVMKAEVGNRPAVMVFLQSGSRNAPVADATRVKNWLESGASGINLASL